MCIYEYSDIQLRDLTLTLAVTKKMGGIDFILPNDFCHWIARRFGGHYTIN